MNKDELPIIVETFFRKTFESKKIKGRFFCTVDTYRKDFLYAKMGIKFIYKKKEYGFSDENAFGPFGDSLRNFALCEEVINAFLKTFRAAKRRLAK